MEVFRNKFQIGRRGFNQVDDGNIGDGMSLAVDISATKLSALATRASASTATCAGSLIHSFIHVQMYCNTPSAQIVDS